MKILEQIKQLTLYVCNPTECRLNSKEEENVFSFVEKLCKSKKAKIIYRGTACLQEEYNTDCNDIPLLSNLIFIVGEKGRDFLKEHKKEMNCVDEIDEHSFNFIWKRMHNKVCRNQFESVETRKRVCQFLHENPKIKEYFGNENKKNDFTKKSGIGQKEASFIVDYYYALLHTIGKSGIKDSYFLSTTSQNDIADIFKYNKDKKEGIIILGWIPKGEKGRIIQYNDMNKFETTIKKYGLPLYNSALYPEQKEFCIKCGLLANFILGFKHKDRFYINPAIMKGYTDETPTGGLVIDNKEFNEILEKTNYKTSFIFADGMYLTV